MDKKEQQASDGLSGEPAMEKKKRFGTFNTDWTKKGTFAEGLPKEYLFSASCIVCHTTIIGKHEGRLALDSHAISKKHQTAILNKCQNRTIGTFMTKKGSQRKKLVAVADFSSVYRCGLSRQ